MIEGILIKNNQSKFTEQAINNLTNYIKKYAIVKFGSCNEDKIQEAIVEILSIKVEDSTDIINYSFFKKAIIHGIDRFFYKEKNLTEYQNALLAKINKIESITNININKFSFNESEIKAMKKNECSGPADFNRFCEVSERNTESAIQTL